MIGLLVAKNEISNFGKQKSKTKGANEKKADCLPSKQAKTIFKENSKKKAPR